MQHLLVTQDFLPDMSGAARRHVALARRYPEPMAVSTVSARDVARHDAAEEYAIERQHFVRERAGAFINRLRWQRWLTNRCNGRIHVLHAGDIEIAGRVVWRTHKRLRIPYLVYVSAGSVARARAETSARAKRIVRLVLGDAAGIVATTEAVALAARELMAAVAISQPPPVAALGLGTDPALFGPDRDVGALRSRWGIRRAPIMLTVARLSPHKGQDTGIQALALLRQEFPDLRYVLVGEGSDEARLRNLAAELNVMDRVGFAGSMRDDELPEAYATATIYLDASRPAPGTRQEGNATSLIEAASAGLPLLASNLLGTASIVRNGETGMLIDPTDPAGIASAIASMLIDSESCREMGMHGRESVESHFNWNRVARDTARFVRECVANG
ncbi:MAG: glycosyltransferase family 4 protein [Gemmatimonadaceae bacterium]